MSTNIGLTKSKLGKSSIKTTVSRSIAGAQRSTVASSAMSRTGSLFGIYAQRSDKNPFSYRGYNDEQTWALRHSLNDSRTPVFNNIIEGYPHYHEDNSNKGLGIAMGVGMGLGALLTGIAALKEAGIIGKKEVVTDRKVESDSVSDSDPDFKGDTSALSAMSSANDSTTLRAAISSAQTELSQLKAKLPGLKSASDEATTQLKDLKPQVKEKEEKVASQQKEVNEKQSTFDKTKEKLEKSEERLRSADKEFDTACSNLETANKNLTNAKNRLASAEANIDPNTNQPVEPEYSEAKDAVKDAENAVTQAESAKRAAAGTLEQAKEDNNIAKQRYLEAQQDFSNAEQELKTSQEQLKILKEDLDKLEQQQSDAQKKINDYKNAEATIKALESEIPTQQRRLTELEQQEQNALGAAEDTILELKDKMAGKDGILGNDDDRKLRRKDQKKYDNALQTQKNVNYTDLYKQAPEENINGKDFRTGVYDGVTLYMVDEKPVTEAEYKLTKARERENSIGFD